MDLGAAINLATGGTVAGTVPDTLDLYDLTSPATPVLLNRYNFPINAALNGNRIGQVIFAADNVFAIDANNGVMAFTVASGPIPPPTFLTHPKSRRIIEGSSATLSVIIDQTATLQWFKDGVAVGTGASYPITNAQLSAAGNYWAIGSNANGSATSEVAVVTIELPSDNYSLSPVWNMPPGITLGTDYVTSNGGASSPNERSFAYNALSNQVLIVQCPVGNGAVPTIAVIDANTGVKLHSLSTAGYTPTISEVAGSNPINMLSIAVAEDGAVYACNGTPNASGGSDGATEKKFRVYRWPHSGSDAQLTLVYEGDPSGNLPGTNVRWGDSLDARGSGLNTELILDSNDGVYGAVLTPVDSGMNLFTNSLFSSIAGAGSIGRSLQFGNTNSVWQKRRGSNLYRSSYNLTNQTASPLANIDFQSSSLGGTAVDAVRGIAAGVDFVGNASTPDGVALYDIVDPATPMLIARYNFPANQPGNNNSLAKTLIVGDKIFALDGNSGFATFNIASPVGPQLTATLSGNQITVSWPTSITGFTLQSTPTLSPADWQNVATPTNAFNSVTENISGGAKFYRLLK